MWADPECNPAAEMNRECGFLFLPDFDAGGKCDCLDFSNAKRPDSANHKRTDRRGSKFVNKARSRIQDVSDVIGRMRKHIKVLNGAFQPNSSCKR